MTAKIRVKDIAKELGVGNKEIMQVLRELGIQAKSQLGALTEEEASQVRVQLRKDQGRTRVVDTEVQPGVIIRRRKTTVAPEPEPEPELPAEPEAGPAETAEPVLEAAPEAEISAEPAEAPKPAPRRDPHTARVVVLETPPAPADEEPETAEAAPADATGTEPETAAGEEPDQTGEPSTADLTEAVAGAEAETPAETPSDDTAAPAETSEEDKAAEAARRGRKPRRVETPEPKVRIISMPAPKPPAPPAEPRRAAADSGRPAGPGARPAGPGGRPAVPGVPGAPATTDEAGKKKRKKDRRVVEFTPQTAEEEAARRTGVAAAVKKKKIHDIQDKTGRGGKYKRKRPRDQQPVMPQMPAGTQPLKAAKRKIRMDETIRVGDMARQMGIKAQDLIKILLSLGVMATINQSLDVETATLAAAEFEYEVEKVGFSEDDYLLAKEEDLAGDLKPRPPVVTIMGHVDHGKTSLLDAIRLSNIASGEAGGITQHIGAYHVTTSRGDIVFLDTPGHEAFTAMRARGAQVTDIVVLVVAADDGVMDQTREALSHSRAAGVPIVVAVNKIDKPEANTDRVKRELADLGLVAEDWGGDAIFAHVSAKQKIGLDALLEMILLQAEVLELKANPNKRARGHIVEARLDKGRGPVGSILIQEGTLRQGDAFVCGVFSGRVRALFDDQGRKIKEAGPAMPVEVQGFEGVPEAGDEFVCVEDDKVARRIAESRLAKQRERELGKASKITLETFLAARGEAEAQNLNLVLKADVQGSLEAISEALNKLSTDKVRVGIIHSGAGAITESDILLASASQAIIIGFNVRPTLKIKEIAERENVDIRFYDIIYQLVADVKDAMSGMLAPVFREQYLGQAEVRNTFSVPKIGTVAGCGVLDGKLTRNAGVRLLRDGVVVYTGKLASLRRFKDDVKEVTKGYECGVGLENYNDIKIGDVIEAFESVEEKDTLE